VSQKEWATGKFSWIVEPELLLPSVIEEMVDIVLRSYDDNNKKPGEVGRKDAAYRLCDSAVAMELSERGKV
jgi:hypothetical protein